MAVDLVVCSALGVDMFDCVFPTRTAVSTTKVAMYLACHLQITRCDRKENEKYSWDVPRNLILILNKIGENKGSNIEIISLVNENVPEK